MKRFFMILCKPFFCFFLCLWFGLGLPCQAEPAQPIRGQIDLSNIDLQHREIVPLQGEWAFYWQQLLSPADFRTEQPVAESDFVALPSNWSKTTLHGQPLAAQGYATYRLTLLPPDGVHDLALRVDEISSAHRLWINGALAQEIGVVGRDLESEVKNSSRRVVRFTSRGQPLELLLQVSNFHGRTGLVPRIELASAATLEQKQARELSLAVLLAGGMLLMCLYHLAVFVMRRKELSFLYFSLYCLVRIDYTVCQGASDGVIRLLFPEIQGGTVYALTMTGLYLSPLLSLAFFRSLYPKEFSSLVLSAVALLSFGLILINVLNGFALMGGVQLFFYAVSIIIIPYYLYGLFRAWRAQHAGAELILMGYLLLGFTLVNDMLLDMQLIHSVFLIPVGMFIFVLFQSFALARRFTRAFSSVEELSDQLEQQNAILQSDMAEHIRLEHEIEQISEKERRAISRELHDGLCQQLTAARLHCSVLRREYKGQEETGSGSGIETMAGLLHTAVDHAYALSRGLWPVEHDGRDLVASLDELAGQLRSDLAIEVTLRCEQTCKSCLNTHASSFYYIAREALQNIRKHASASHVLIVLDCQTVEHTLVLRIEDDGVGRIKRTSHGGLGLRIMAHRARSIGGELSISDRSGGGTVVCLSSPCAKPNPVEDAP
ncbi:MAG: 7TM diverse intracellular signaling domain-containing protein [Betaproteobacteria bacterium]